MSLVRMFPERPSSHWKVQQTPDLGQEMETRVVLPFLKVFWLSKDCSLGTVKRKRRDRLKKSQKNNNKGWTGMEFATQLGQLKIVLGGKGLLESHLWCLNNHCNVMG